MKKILQDLSFAETEALVLQMGEKKFRAKQLFEGLTQGKALTGITSLSKDLKARLLEEYEDAPVRVREVFYSSDGTEKYLFELSDGNLIEGVLMKYKYGYTQCVSTQVGCRMGCKFCASTKNGRKRNLTAGEIANQIYMSQRDLDIRISNIVLMGIGEPLDNFDNVIRFLQLISDEKGVNIGMRHISLSTCGIVPKIKELEKLNLQLTLSISLHAPNDEIRSSMMPINNKYPLCELIDACRSYVNTTGRRISFEYSVVKGVNDSEECAKELAKLLRGMLCHINLIPVNQIEEGGFVRPDNDRIRKFENTLLKLGMNATVRRTLGSDISASCGQLRGEMNK